MKRVTVGELRLNLSRYLAEVQAGESYLVTERGREVARLTLPGPSDSPLARLAAERGATLPSADLASLARRSRRRPASGPPSEKVLGELREEKL